MKPLKFTAVIAALMGSALVPCDLSAQTTWQLEETTLVEYD